MCHIVDGTDQRAKALLENELERSTFDRRDRDLATELVYGTLRRRGTLDAVIGSFSRLPLRKIQPRVLEILRIGAYQLLFFDKVPASAAVVPHPLDYGTVRRRLRDGAYGEISRDLARFGEMW